MKISPLAGKPAPPGILVDVPRLITAYYIEVPGPLVPEQRAAFGISGHRGSSFELAFNEWHILAITRAICLYRERQNIDGPLYLGMDAHALSVPACATALEVLAASGWFATRPSGTDDIYKIYAESFRGAEHLRHILEEVQTIANVAIAPAAPFTTNLKGR
jgi:phosphoglucomutase